jgi:hypothetical protein
MKVESVAPARIPAAQTEELPLIKAEEIKSILYLGLRGTVHLDTGKTHTIDTYA